MTDKVARNRTTQKAKVASTRKRAVVILRKTHLAVSGEGQGEEGWGGGEGV